MNDEDYDWMAGPATVPLEPVRSAPPWELATLTDTPVVPGWHTDTMTMAAPGDLKENDDDTAARRSDDRGLLRARARARRSQVRPVDAPDVGTRTLTVIVPAYNEAAGLPETLTSVMRQTEAADRVLVVDDGSSDGTAEVALAYGAEVLRRDQSSGSKSAALNYGLLECDTDLVLNVDGDTVIADNYVKLVKAAFADPMVAVAAGSVGVWNPKGILQRGRQAEYLLSFHLFRPVQNAWGSPLVCSGAACAYDREPLAAAGGFPDDTVGEDMDYTWRMMLAGRKAVYVAGAECYAIDPKTTAQLRTQLWRWMSGYFQCLRLHWREILRHKKLLGLLAVLSVMDLLSLPLWLATPFAVTGSGREIAETALLSLVGTDLLISLPVVLVGAARRKISIWWTLASFPCIWVLRAFNAYYFTKAMIWELALVPCEWKTSLSVFKKGHA
ncbi:MAG TPA: glycosyltransferase family 2 protein [Trebonia sp.]